jgi:hypothetical protein
MTIKNLETILIQTGFNIERMKEDKLIKEEAYIVLKARNKKALSEIKAYDKENSAFE